MMTIWATPCNPKNYLIKEAFDDLKFLNWKQSVGQISIGDLVYIYVSNPIASIKYKCIVTKVGLKEVEIDDSKYVISKWGQHSGARHMELKKILEFDDDRFSLENLRLNGLKGQIQGTRRLKDDVVLFLQSNE